MNFLAHLLLSPKEEGFIVGNILADFMRGYRNPIPNGMKNGIMMHQFVDEFTDSHLVVKKSRGYLKDDFGILSGVLVDVFYDHFMAIYFHQFASMPLDEFCRDIYTVLRAHLSELPPRLQEFTLFMIREDVLFSYRSFDGIKACLERINDRISRKFPVSLAIEKLQEGYDFLRDDFLLFFPLLVEATACYRKNYEAFLK